MRSSTGAPKLASANWELKTKHWTTISHAIGHALKATQEG